MAGNDFDYMATRRSLLSRLKDLEDQETWQEFFDKYWKMIYSVARKAGLSDADAQDVVQDVLLTIYRKIQGFKYDPERGKFRGWLLHTTRWRVEDRRRKHKPEDIRRVHRTAGDTRMTGTLDRIPAPESVSVDAIWEEEWHNHLLERACERVKQQVSPKQFQIFDCYVLQGWSVKKVAQTLGVSATQAYLAKHRIQPRFKKELERIKAEEDKQFLPDPQ